MLEKVEKCILSPPPCRINKSMFAPLKDLFKDLEVEYRLQSVTMDMRTDDVTLFVNAEWPAKVSSIEIKARAEGEDIEVLLDFEKKSKEARRVSVSGKDPVWVRGMANEICSLFSKQQVWYSPIAKHFYVRLPVSLLLISLVSWLISHNLFKLIANFAIGIAELPFAVLVLLLLTWLLYPIDHAVAWMFPWFDSDGSPQRKVRNAFGALLIILVSWVITEILLPHLLQ